MPRLRHTVEQILAKLREAEVALCRGQSAGQTCRALSITEQTYYRWRNESGGLKGDQVKRLKELERENTRLTRAVADLTRKPPRETSKPSAPTADGNPRCATLGLSERRVCRVLGQPRATQRYQREPHNDEAALTQAIVELASQYGRHGYHQVSPASCAMTAGGSISTVPQ